MSGERRNVLQESLAAIQRLQSRIDRMEAARHEPIAIVGMACRYPGGAETPEALWEILRSGTDAVAEVPRERWDIDAYHDPDPKASGKMITRRGGFLRQVDQFDPAFFGISPREATTLDPQQRLLLEAATEALERAGIATDSLAGSATGVFVGITTTDYRQVLSADDPDATDVYSATGNALNAAAGRISFTFGFQGPCVALDTACSSSLVAVHLACQSLRTGESNLALAGGVNVVLRPEAMVLFSKWGMMAPDGKCKTFDAAADGFVRAEGCAVIALKRLSDAVAAGDPVLAVIRGSAVNSDGRSSGLTAPNGPAQEAVLRKALAAAQLGPADIDYVEAHGTGTPLGDPIEVEALAHVMAEGRDASRPLLLGSIKTNLGHTEAASGLAGLLKTVLSLQHEVIPPHLHLETLNPRIDWTSAPMAVPTKATPWPRGERPRRAGVSSFGFSGTNAHVVIEEAPVAANDASGGAADKPVGEATTAPATAGPALSPQLIVLSGHTALALRELAARHAAWLGAQPGLRLEDIALTLASGRAHQRHRLAFVADDRAALVQALQQVASGHPVPGAAEGQLRASERPRVAFVFTGQGSQYAGMGRRLYESEPVFRAVIDSAQQILGTRLEHPLTEVLWGSQTARLDETGWTQPALYALEVGLAELWRSWGITPAAVLGHSVGEYSAACVAGVFSFEEGLALIAERARLMQALPAGGAMAALFCAPERVTPLVARAPRALSIAAVNGPEETVISGDAEAVQQALAELAQQGVQGRALTVSHAFHSPRLDPMLDAFERHAAATRFDEPHIMLVSNVTGTAFAPGARPDAAYWRAHARGSVRFADGLKALRGSGATVLIEIGPHPTLLGMAARAEPQATWVTTPSLRREQDDRRVLRSALGTLYSRGAAIAWPAVSFANDARRVVLPTYAFQRERYWIGGGPETTAAATNGTHALAVSTASSGHPLLGAARELASPVRAWLWEQVIGLDSHPWLADHRVQGTAIVPATAYIEMAIAAGRETLAAGSVVVRRIENAKPMILRDGERRRVQASLTPQVDGSCNFVVHSRAADGRDGGADPWIAHMSAEVSVDTAATAGSATQALSAAGIEALRQRCAGREFDGSAFYAALARKGNQWGPCFQGLAHVWTGAQEALARVQVPPALAADVSRYRFHPAVSDACGHALVATGPIVAEDEARGTGRSGAFVGAGVGEVRFHRSPRGRTLWSHAQLKPSPDEARGIVVGDVRIYDEDGTLVGETLDARLWYLDEQASAERLGAPADWFYEVQWRARERGVAGARVADFGGPWLVLADRSGVADALAAERRAQGLQTVLVRPGEAIAGGDDRSLPDPTRPEAWQRLLQEVMQQHGPVAAVLHLWLLDERSADDWRPALERGALAALHLLHALRHVPQVGRPRLWFATSGAQPVGTPGGCEAPAAALLWGIGRSLAAEHGESWGGLVDLDPGAPAAASALALLTEVTGADSDDRIAWRLGQRHVARLVRRIPQSAPLAGGERPSPPDAGGGTVIVTGGLGGIGLAMARWSVQRGARHVLLLGRQGLSERTQWDAVDARSADGARIAAVRALESAGAEVEVAALDVSDFAALQALLAARTVRGAPPVRGVLHAAGVLRFEALDTQAADDLPGLLAAKVGGAWNLHRLLGDEPLAFFVMCSSTSALLASPLLGGYAAGNAALDALAQHRRALGRAALSINWGTWGETGMAVQAGHATSMLTGLQTMDTARALAAMQELMQGGAAQAAVMPVDWAALAGAYAGFAADPFFEDLVGPAAAATPRAAAGGMAPGLDLQRLRGASPEEQATLLRPYLRSGAARLLGMAEGRLDPGTPLATLGFDSLMAVQLKNGIEAELGIVVPMIRFLQGPSVDELLPAVQEALTAAHRSGTSALSNGAPTGPKAEQEDWEEGTL